MTTRILLATALLAAAAGGCSSPGSQSPAASSDAGSNSGTPDGTTPSGSDAAGTVNHTDGGSAGAGDGGNGGDASRTDAGTSPVDSGGAGKGDGGNAAASSCAYDVTPPSNHGFSDIQPDNATAPASAAVATPNRVRLGLGGGLTLGQAGYPDPTTSIAMLWDTSGTSYAAKVKMGSSPTALTDVHTGYSFTISGNATYFHEVHICGLAPATTYYYQVGGGPSGSEVWSATQSFTTLPTSGPITIGVSGDARDSATIYQTLQQRMKSLGVNMQLFSGDLVLTGTLESLFQQWLTAAWQDPSNPGSFLTLGEQLILPVGGNHEAQSSQYYANVVLPGTGTYAETMNSITVGSAHVLMLDDDVLADSPSDAETVAQLAWIDQDLTAAEADRAKHPFIIAIHHRGEYSTSTHAKDTDVLEARGELAPLWAKHHVDLVLSGHDHNYERSYPITPNATNPQGDPVVQATLDAGMTYIVCAGAGASGYAPGTGTAAWRAFNWGFNTGSTYEGVYGVLTLDGHTMTWNAYGLATSGADPKIDTLTFTR